MSFYCEHCHFKNTEVQSAGEIQEKGAKYALNMDKMADLERQIVKSDTAGFIIKDPDLEIPLGRGKLTNLEGIFSEIVEDLKYAQPQRREQDPKSAQKIDAVIEMLSQILRGERFPCSVLLDDPAGNSWIEPSPNESASKYLRTEYARSPQQNMALGLAAEPANATRETDSNVLNSATHNLADVSLVEGARNASLDGMDILEGKMYSLPCQCPGCMTSAIMNIQMVNIPYFKQVMVNAVVCDHCGYRTSDVKTGGEIPLKGQRIQLCVRGPHDLRRDILKSETCNLRIPACRVEVVPGTMGGRFTTVEGLLTQIRDDLKGSIFDMDIDEVAGSFGDSMPENQKSEWLEFFGTLDKAIRGEMEYTVHLEDPFANSYIQSLTAPDPDPQIDVEDYDRTAEEEEELGLTDMRTKMSADGEYVREEKATVSGGTDETT